MCGARAPHSRWTRDADDRGALEPWDPADVGPSECARSQCCVVHLYFPGRCTSLDGSDTCDTEEEATPA